MYTNTKIYYNSNPVAVTTKASTTGPLSKDSPQKNSLLIMMLDWKLFKLNIWIIFEIELFWFDIFKITVFNFCLGNTKQIQIESSKNIFRLDVLKSSINLYEPEQLLYGSKIQSENMHIYTVQAKVMNWIRLKLKYNFPKNSFYIMMFRLTIIYRLFRKLFQLF